jgi:hypothetical protein
VPFVRFSRDKRGYENFFLIDSDARGPGGKQKHRILYWFRTPPNVKVGRKPFDDRATRELEATNPGVMFDWEKLRNTPIPPVQSDYWRERRRSERAAREGEAEMEEPGGAEAGMPGAPVAADAVECVAASHVAEPGGELPQPGAESGPPQRRRRRRRRSAGDRRQHGQVAAYQFEEQADRRTDPSIISDEPIGSGESSGHTGEDDYDDDAQSQE